ncbi:EamA-like transporter family protein [Novosphingobium sp. PhB57]|uniref:DMT family transporter n=1 Tax=unclassified Novosphingobium TaxID=2644732 RepID=UPI001046D0F3|nr:MULTISPECIES: DMT family transporter [unclassified Novosphingobium]TCU54792.1 EamA-like transporter family protein [Novosphingobium sp. PhB57]TDW60383.1 EamA-like transporter family protein [Novosphingobium sp. PhB55]
MSDARNTIVGVGFGAAAGAVWGLVFLAPELAGDFGPLYLAAGRYLAYGLIAAALLVPRWPMLVRHLGRTEWIALAWLSLLGNTLYYILLSSAVQMAGIAVTSLIIGFIPVVVTIVGSRDASAPSLARLAPSLLLGIGAIGCIGWQTLASSHAQAGIMPLIGLLCAVGALASWATFAIINSRWLVRLEHVSAHDWSLLLGIVTGLQAVVLVPLALLLEPAAHDAAAWYRFLAVSGAVALFASVVGNALWNTMSRLLPLTMVGQMILFETAFALLYAFLWEARLPTVPEMLAIACMGASVVSCLTAHGPRRAAAVA